MVRYPSFTISTPSSALEGTHPEKEKFVFRIISLIALVALLAVGLVACGGDKGQEGADAGQEAMNAGEDAAANQDPAAEETSMETAADDGSAQEAQETQEEATPKYDSVEDPNAVYTMQDIKMEGSWLKLNLSDLTDDQLNRVVHRSRTEFCTCGCPEDTIDECLVNDPACGTAVTLVRQIIREEKLKG